MISIFSIQQSKKKVKPRKAYLASTKTLSRYLKQLLQNLQNEGRNTVSEFVPIKETVLRQNLNP